MAFEDIALRLLRLSGITNIVFFLLIFLSCRCMGGIGLANRLFKYKSFQKFYNLHCYFWWGFWISVIVHASLAFYIFGFNF